MAKNNKDKYQVKFYFEDGDTIIEDDEFDDTDSAREYAKDWISDYHTGSEILEMSNPGDYPYDEDEKVRYRVIKSRK